MYADGDAVVVVPGTPPTYDAVRLRIRAARTAELSVWLIPDGQPGGVQPELIPLGKLLIDPHTSILDERGNRLLVRASRGTSCRSASIATRWSSRPGRSSISTSLRTWSMESKPTIRWSAPSACSRPAAKPSSGKKPAKRGSGGMASHRRSVPSRGCCPKRRAFTIYTSRSANGGCRRVSLPPKICASAASSWSWSIRNRLRRPWHRGKSWPRPRRRPTPSAARPPASGNRSPSCRTGSGCRARIPAASKRRSATV